VKCAREALLEFLLRGRLVATVAFDEEVPGLLLGGSDERKEFVTVEAEDRVEVARGLVAELRREVTTVLVEPVGDELLEVGLGDRAHDAPFWHG
jgi:hypothetical protein